MRQGILQVADDGSSTSMIWQNGGTTVTVQGFMRSDGNLLGITGDWDEFNNAMTAMGESFQHVVRSFLRPAC
jgi:hypothetical protein